MTREKHLLGHLIFQTNEGDVAVASKQITFELPFGNTDKYFLYFTKLLHAFTAK